MDVFKRLVILAALPTFVSIFSYLLLRRKKDHDDNRWQIYMGIIFGISAIISTEFGVPHQGAIINARLVSPLCAGLIFGPTAGIIAGLIGGIERWLCVYWGGGYYTRLACSLSTILTGFIAAYLRHNIYEDKLPDWLLAMFSGVFCETLDMVLIFLTSLNDVKNAFEYVLACSQPMITATAIGVGITVLIIQRIETDLNGNRYVPSVSSQFQKMLVLAVMAGLLLSSGITYMVQRSISRNDNYSLLQLNVIDTSADVFDQIERKLIEMNMEIAEDYYGDIEDVEIGWLADYYGVAEINIIDSSGSVVDSNVRSNIGFDLAKSNQQREFLYLLYDLSQLSSKLEPSEYPSGGMRKYSGVRYNNTIVQIAYNQEQYEKDLLERLQDLTINRRVGEAGLLMIADEQGYIISDIPRFKGDNVRDYGIDLKQDANVVKRTRLDDVDYYYLFDNDGDFYTFAFLPVDEADFSMLLATYMSIFMAIIIFGLLFVVINFISKAKIVNNISKVNNSLNRITEGHLDTVVDVRTSQEFVSLSDGINSTVDSLKMFIKEANERIDSELRYAKEIQFSALPSNFPAFPDRNEFDIYALMDPAKEVGGDFYDFYMLGDHNLAFLVADVAGKGIPASLFMMRAKTTIKTYAEGGLAVADIFTNANYQLCEGNDADMFVTAWMGILNLETGELKYANAGHNRPLIRRKDGDYEYLQGPAGFVLAGMEGIAYKEQSLKLEPGDEIFLYTDGVVEATDPNLQLYGDDRLQECANRNKDADAMALCKNIKEDVDKFYEGADQFDDITELSMKFIKYQKAY